jgi:hypothetical protein
MKNTTTDIESTMRRRRLRALLTPSWLSLLLAVMVGFGIVAWVIVSFTLRHSGYTSQLLLHPNSNEIAQPVLTLPGQNPPGVNTTNSLQNTWPLIAFWAVVGLVVYFIVDMALNMINNFHEFEQELNYVHAKRNMILKATIELLIIRVIIVFLWLYFLNLFFKWLIPAAINLAHNSVQAINLYHAGLDVLYACLILIASMHLNAIFIRLILRRSRVFSQADYTNA